MEQQYLIDSNAVIDYLGSKFTDSGMNFMNNIINASPNVSVITKDLMGPKNIKIYWLILSMILTYWTYRIPLLRSVSP